MIPAFDEHGYLPPGIHRANLEQIAERFAQQSELRRVQMESLRWLVGIARRAGVARIIVNGSFVTDIVEPNDVDCVLLGGPEFTRDVDSEAELLAGLPFLEIQLVEPDTFEYLVQRFFSTDRDGVPKGVVEVML